MILEHFADNREEQELAEAGMLLWGNGNFNFNEATMGYHDNGKSDLSWQSYQQRGWGDAHLVGYMESHDEERLMYKNLTFGNSSGSYTTRRLETALERNKMALAFFMAIPGPKMIWQFGELGYEFSINRCVDGRVDGCRLDRKPIRWDYQSQTDRRSLFDLYAGLIRLKQEEDIFETDDFEIDFDAPIKTIHLHHNPSNTHAVGVGNFDVVNGTIDLDFDHTGIWYDVITGDSLMVNSSSVRMELEPGAHYLYMDKDVRLISSSKEIFLPGVDITLAPNPVADFLNVSISSERDYDVAMSIVNSAGQVVSSLELLKIWQGDIEVDVPVHQLKDGVYYLSLNGSEGKLVQRFIKITD